MLSFRQIFAAVTIEQRFEGVDPQAATSKQIPEPQVLDMDQLSFVSGGKSDIPGGGW